MSNEELILGLKILVVFLLVTYFIIKFDDKKKNKVLKTFTTNVQNRNLEIYTENLSLDLPLSNIDKIKKGRLSSISNLLASLFLVIVLLFFGVPNLISFSGFFSSQKGYLGGIGYVTGILWILVPGYFMLSLIKAIINTGQFYVKIIPGKNCKIKRNLVLIFSDKNDALKFYKQLNE